MNCYRGGHNPHSDLILEVLLQHGASVNPRRENELPALLEVRLILLRLSFVSETYRMVSISK